jgi:sortase A
MRVVTFFGKLLISLGIGVLLFVGWTLWGTGIYTNRAQDRLAGDFASLPSFPRRGAGSERRPGRPPGDYRPAPGDPVFRLRVPAIDLSQIVVEGVGTEELKGGPGHYPACREGFTGPYCTRLDEVWPGERGRVIVSGHRTTYGAPFWALNELQRGDDIITETKWGTFSYEVSGTDIVPPTATDIANPAATNSREIVLTTCNPRFSAAERLIVFARLEEG